MTSVMLEGKKGKRRGEKEQALWVCRGSSSGTDTCKECRVSVHPIPGVFRGQQN
jgi:hypothetical protein